MKLNDKNCRYLPIVLIFSLSIIFFYPVIFNGKTFFAFDCLFTYLPWSSLYKDFIPNNPLISDTINVFYTTHHSYKLSVDNCIFPLWDNLNFCGKPFAPYSSPFFYFFYTLFPLLAAHDLLLFFHLAGIGLFTYLYLKLIGLKTLPSLIGTVAWMFNGYVMVWFEFENVPMMAFTLSASLLFIELWWKKRSTFTFLGMICSIALSICVAYAHLIIYQLIFIGFYLLYRFFTDMREKRLTWRQACRPLWGPILAIAISFIVASIFFTTRLLTYKDSQREPIPYSDLFEKTGQLPPKYLTTMLFPDFFGSPTNKTWLIPRYQDFHPYNNYNELCIYSGILSLFLALACIPYFGKKKYISFFLITTILCISMSMGSILYYPLAKFVPGLNLSTPTRILYIFGFSVSMLAALGANIIQREDQKRKLQIMILWILVLIAAIIITSFVQSEKGVKWAASSNQLNHRGIIPEVYQNHFSIFYGIILKPLLISFSAFIILTCVLYSPTNGYRKFLLLLGLFLLAYDLISFGQNYNTTSPRDIEYPSTPAIRFLQTDKSKFRIITMGRFLKNSFAPFGIESIGGYGSFYPSRYGEYLHLSQHGTKISAPERFSRWISLSRFGSPLLDLLNTKYVLLPPDLDVESDRLKRVYTGEINIYENLYAFPRMFFVPQYQLATDRRNAYHTLGKFTRDDFFSKVILESHPPKDFVVINDKSMKEIEAKISLISYRPNKIELKIKSNSNGFLVLSDSYHPNWYAKVDGKRTAILRANYIMRAIQVAAGKHRIIFTYRPKYIIIGLAITAIGWIVIFSAIGGCMIRKLFIHAKTKKL